MTVSWMSDYRPLPDLYLAALIKVTLPCDCPHPNGHLTFLKGFLMWPGEEGLIGALDSCFDPSHVQDEAGYTCQLLIFMKTV